MTAAQQQASGQSTLSTLPLPYITWPCLAVSDREHTVALQCEVIIKLCHSVFHSRRMRVLLFLTFIAMMQCYTLIRYSPSSLFKARYHSSREMRSHTNGGGELDFFSSQCSQWMRSMGVLVLAVGTITSTNPHLAYAAPSKEASKLFALAEEAIDQTAQDYKKVDQVWSATKKNIHDLYQQTNQYNKQFQAIETDVQTIITRLTKLITIGDESVVKIQSELDALSKSVAEKYAIAETSANKLEKPAITAKYFTAAQNEALILEEDTKELKNLQDIINQHKVLLNRLQTVSDHLNRINTIALVEVKNDQDNGVRDLVDGIASNLKSCRDQLNECVRGGQEGLNTFKRGSHSFDCYCCLVCSTCYHVLLFRCDDVNKSPGEVCCRPSLSRE